MRRLGFVVLLGLVACHIERPAGLTHAEAGGASPSAVASGGDGGMASETAPVATFPLPVAPEQCGRRLDVIEKAILDGSAAPSAARVTSAPWDRATPPARLDRIEKRFGLRAAEREVLAREGFVVADRLGFDSYSVALHEIHQSQLPIYVSVDAVLHAVFVSHDELLERFELARVAPALERVLAGLAKGLREHAADYPADVVQDLTTYVEVARALLDGSPAKTSPDVAMLVDKATKGASLEEVALFGRPRMIDFSQYAPRGHYAKSPRLSRFFRASMWLSRLELNLVSRSSRSSQPGVSPNPEETPREAADALVLADLADRSGVLAEVGAIDAAWGVLAGVREDVPLAELARIRHTLPAGPIATNDAFAAVKKELGDRFERTTRLHYMPQGSTRLPAIATMLGPRVVRDAAATRPLVHGELPERYDLHAADVAFLLGHDRAKRYLASDLAAFPGLDAALVRARTIALAPEPPGAKDVYGAWMDAVASLATPPAGTKPSYMQSTGFADLRIDEALAAYGQVKHNHVLLAGQPYDEGACAVPDGWVDPAPGTWDGIVRLAERGGAAFAELDPKDSVGGLAYFARVARIAKVLRAIAAQELSGRPLTPDMLAFLANVVEIHSDDIGTGFMTSYNGWYFDLFLSRPEGTTAAPPGRDDHAAMKYAGFIADWYTSVNTGNVAYVGAKEPRLGIFVVDTGGPPRIVVGPVATAFEHQGPLTHRLKDSDVRKLNGTSAPWAASYAIAPAPEPALAVTVTSTGADDLTLGHSSPVEVVLVAKQPVGAVTITLYDHHREAVAEKTVELGAGKLRARVMFPARVQRVLQGTHATEMVGIACGEYRATFDMFAQRGVSVGLGGMRVRETGQNP